MLYVSKRTKNVFSDRFDKPTNVKVDEIKPTEITTIKPLEEIIIEENIIMVEEPSKKRKSKKNNEENIEEDGRE